MPEADPRLDVVGAPPVERVVIVAGTLRSGSTLLGNLLGGAGVGRPAEFLNPAVFEPFASRWGVPRPTLAARRGRLRRRLHGDPAWRRTEDLTRRSLRRYLELAARHRTTPNGIFSAKVLAVHLPTLLRTGLDFDLWGPVPEFVLIERSDRVAQAVSWARALQDGSWASDEPRPDGARPVYDERSIRARLDAIDAGQERWAAYFAVRGISPWRISYESLDADYGPVMRRLLDDLGLPDAELGPPGIERQRDEVNAEWVRRFRQSHAPGSGGRRPPSADC